MFLMDMNRRVAALAVVAALSLGGPLAAAGWETPVGRVDSGDFLGARIFTRFLVWLGVTPVTVTPVPEVVLKCDRSSSIDPNGCPKALSGKRGASIDPNGALNTATTNDPTSERGASIDPNGLH